MREIAVDAEYVGRFVEITDGQSISIGGIRDSD